MTHDPIKDDVIEDEAAATFEDITPKDLMQFAKLILGVIAVPYGGY